MSFNLDFRAQIEGDSEIQKKIDDFVKALEDLEKAGDDVERPLSDAAKAMDDVAKAAGGVGKDISDAESALADLSKSAGDADKALVDADKAFSDVSASSADMAGELADADSAFNDIASDADASASSLDAVNSSFETVSSSAQDAETNIQAAATGIEGIGTSTDQATSALEGMGSAFEGAGTATTTFNDVLSSTGSAAQSAAGGLEQANTLVGNFGASADSARGSTEGLTGSVAGSVGGFTAMGSIVTSTVSTLFRMEDAQLRLDKANLMVERSTEMARKAQVAFDNILSTASSNASGISEARERLSQALERLNALEEAGVRTGEAYRAAQQEVAAATAVLREEFTAGGGDIEKFDAAVNKMTLTLDRVQLAMNTAEKAQRTFNMTSLELPISIAGLAGSIVQAIASADKFKDALTGVQAAITAISFIPIAKSVTTVLVPALAAAYAGFVVFETVPTILKSVNAQLRGDMKQTAQEALNMMEILKKATEIDLGPLGTMPLPFGGDVFSAIRPALEQYIKDISNVKDANIETGDSFTDIEGRAKTAFDRFAESVNVLTGKNTELGTSTQEVTKATEAEVAAIAGIKQEIEGARAGIDSYIAGVQEQIEASGTLESTLRQTNLAMQENISQTMDLVGQSENADSAILKLNQSYADHQVAIDQLNTSLNTTVGQMASYQTAVAAGDEAFLRWVQTTRDAAVEADTFKANLEGMAQQFGGLPAHMEGTVEEYQAFIRANTEGGEAAEAFADMVLESWRGLVSAAEPLFNDLKGAWSDIFEGETFDKATEAVDKVNAKIRENMEHNAAEMQKANQKLGENMATQNEQVADNAEQMYQDILKASQDSGEGQVSATKKATYETVGLYEGVAPQIKDVYEGVDWEGLAAATTDPFVEAFNKLPMMVSDQLDIVEREALTLQAKFAEISENAGTVFATNLQANMNLGFDEALRSANQAVADMLAPFVAEHPELAEMFNPLFEAMNQTGPGAAQAVQDVLEEMSGIPGPVGDVASDMLTNYQTEFGGKMPGVTKTGVEGAIQELGGLTTGMETSMKNAIDALSLSMENGFKKVIAAINKLINEDIKQDPASVPLVTVNTNPANEQIQNINNSLIQLKDFLARPENQITLTASQTNPLDAQIQLIGTSLQQVKDLLAVPLTVTVDTGPAGIALEELTGKIDAMAGKNVTITVDTGPAGIAITGLQSQIDAVHGTNVFITVDTGAAGLAITGIQGQIDGVHGKEVAITVDTGAAGIAITQIQQQIDQVHGTNVYITVDTSGAQAAIQQLQQQINSLQSSMGGYGGGYGGYTARAPGPYGFAKGFGPAVIDRPTRMLVGEAGPEMVSVIPMKGKNEWHQGGWLTAATGMGYQGSIQPRYPPPGGWTQEQIARDQALEREMLEEMRNQAIDKERQQYEMQRGTQQGTQQGMNQGMPGMQNAVQQGAQQGVEQGMQQGGGGGYQQGGYPLSQMAMDYPGGANAFWNSRPTGTYRWTGGGMGTQITPPGGGGMGGGAGQYPMVNTPGSVQGWGTGVYNWQGGKSGMNLVSNRGHVWGLGGVGSVIGGGGMPGGGGGGNPWSAWGPFSQPGGGVPEGWGYGPQLVSSPAQQKAYDDLLKRDADKRADAAGKAGAAMGKAASTSFIKAFDTGMPGQSQLINGVAATILGGNSNGASQAGMTAGTAAGRSFASSFNGQIGQAGGLPPANMFNAPKATGPINIGQPGFPKPYTGQVPASYGKPLGQLINGIAATILPGQGPRGSPMQAATGMHTRLRKDTLIQAHRNERVDISPGGPTQRNSEPMDQRDLGRITQLLERLLSQGSNFKVDFNVDGRKLSSVAAKNMGTAGYGDK